MNTSRFVIVATSNNDGTRYAHADNVSRAMALAGLYNVNATVCVWCRERCQSRLIARLEPKLTVTKVNRRVLKRA